MKKEKLKHIAKRITAFAAAAAMAAAFTFPAEVGDGIFEGFGNAIVASAETYTNQYDISTGSVTINADGTYRIYGSTTTNTVTVAAGVSADITLDNVTIDVSRTNNTCAFKIEDNSTGNVTIDLVGENTLKSGRNCAGLQKNGSNVSLEIRGTGKLTAKGGEGGAGIGGGIRGAGSNITISSGTVFATGDEGGAGIGGGNSLDGSNGTGSNITISGGTVYAKGGYSGAGIGGGFRGPGSNITISGGTVTAEGGDNGAGIGGGFYGSGSNITISGGVVTANGDEYSAGIGGGYSGDGLSINITGGSVKAVTNEIDVNAIGGGYGKDAVTPTNGTTNVYLLTIKNPNSEAVTIDRNSYTPVNHKAVDNNDGNLYAYLPAKTSIADPLEVKVGTETTNYYYDTTKSAWLAIVDKPAADTTTFTYDGTEQTYTISDSDDYTVTGNKQTNAGTYTVTVSLNDTVNTVWNDGTITDKTYNFTIKAANPTITVTANPSSVITGKATTVTVTAEVKNPNNDTLTDVPTPAISYKIGDGAETPINGGTFVIPANTPNETTFTIIARTSATPNYNAGTGTSTVVVSNCTHPNKPAAWKNDATHHWHKCPDCGAELDKAEHSSNATATETSPEVCKDCEYVMTSALGHIHANHLTFVAEVPETCTTDGVKAHYECDCGKLFADDQAATEVTPQSLKIAAHHSYGTEWVSDNDDDHYHLCSVCGDKTDITDHSYDNGVITTPATEQTTGIKTYTCSECNHTKTEIVSKLDHTHSLATDYSSNATGHWYACSGCTEKVDFEAHTEDSGTVTTEPTETTEGVETFKCVKCEYVMRTETIPPITPEHTHSYGTEWKSDSTSHWHECECGEKADIAAHISNNGVVTVQPTATSTGLRVYSCSVCGYVLRKETIPATGYNGYPSYPTYPTYPFDSSIFNVVSFTDKLNVTAETTGNTVTLKWDKVEKADKYYVYQYKNGKYVKIKTTTDTSVTLKGLKNGETYKFLIRYTKSGRLSPTKYSGTISVKVYNKPIPKPTATKNSIKLTWVAVPEAEKYAVYKYVDGKAIKLTETKKLSVKIGKLIPDTEYKYIVRAYVDGKWTTMLKSDIVTVKTKAE